jgi:Protein of unknown function (DUF2905)
MLKWVIAIFLLVLLLARTPLARKLRLGDLPGDVRMQAGRFKLHLPVVSTVLIALALYLFSRVI